MNFDFSDEQKMFAAQVRRALEKTCPLTEVRRVLEEKCGQSDAAWSVIADLGILGAAIPEEYDGAGLGALELCVAAFEVGYSMAPTPLVGSAGVCAVALEKHADEPTKSKWLPKLASGEVSGSFSLGGPRRDAPIASLPMLLQNGKIEGSIPTMPYGMQASIAIVEARTTAKQSVLCLVELGDKTVQRKTRKTLDATRPLADVVFQDTACVQISQASDTREKALHLLNSASVCLAFEQVGAAQRALEMATNFAKERMAFGQSIGTYQAIKHKLADMYIKIELARVHAYWAAWALNDGASELPLAAASARISAIEALSFAAQENIQTHGGIGFTWESDCQFFYRRARADALMLGSSHGWRDRIIDTLEEKNAA